ncbi:MAG: metalloregulator ArsR/SmtB family transcription factor [Patescibacteria group bacterium]
MNERELERVLKALANRRRVAIVRFLKKRKESSVGDIAGAIKLSFKSTSRHLALLAAADIVDREQRSLSVYYKIAAELPPAARSVITIL